jgi:hypothetical protein
LYVISAYPALPDPDMGSVPGAFLEVRVEVSSGNKGKGMCGNVEMWKCQIFILKLFLSVLCVYGIMCHSDMCSIMVFRN